MEKIQFKKEIRASAKKVFNTMLGLENIKTYEDWTAVFNPTSTYEGSWEKGSKIYFVGFDDSGKKMGMVSEIVENIPFKFVSIRHYGMLDGDNEITEGPMVEEWAGLLENYSLSEQDGVTTVTVDSDTTAEYVDSLSATWAKALNKLKEIAEK